MDIGKSQRFQNEGNATITKVSAMRPGLAKVIEKVCNSRNYEIPKTDLHIVENACCIDQTDTWLLKRVDWPSLRQSMNRSTYYYAWENLLELDSGVTWVSLLISTICQQVAEESNTRWLLFTPHNKWSSELWQVHDRCVEAIPILHHLDVEEAYSYCTSPYH